jgi:hypothetical protein
MVPLPDILAERLSHIVEVSLFKMEHSQTQKMTWKVVSTVHGGGKRRDVVSTARKIFLS